MVTDLVKVTDDLVQQPKTLETLFIDIVLIVELLVVGYGSKHDGNATVALMVQFLE